MIVYQFTEEQLYNFLEEYAGVVLDATGKESLSSLLESLIDEHKLSYYETS